MNIKKSLQIIFFVLLSELAGVIGSVFTVSSVDTWYVTLVKPSFNPPSWVFGPVWTLLYALMGVAAYLVWSRRVRLLQSVHVLNRTKRYALTAFGVQLVLNTLWSIIFFAGKSPGYALIEILFLWCAIVATTVLFYKISKPAAYLMLPYLAWVTFASYLNYTLWTLN